MELGEYSPVELLLAEGRLLYADYEKWLLGEVPYLESCLFGDPQRVKELLSEAAAYAVELGLQADETAYDVDAGARVKSLLRYSADAEANQLFMVRYGKAQGAPQLDLFMDSGAVVLANDVQQALLQGDNERARRCLEQLYELDPNYARLGEFDSLLAANERVDAQVDDVGQYMEYLQQELSQMAQLVFGGAARQYMARHWRALARQLAETPFNPEAPCLHLSYVAAQSLDWGLVESAVKAQAGWQNDAVLLLRYAEACERQYKPDQALWAWFLLCWQFPDKCGLIENHAGEANRETWLAFLDADLDLADTDFPAWVLLQKPGLSKTLPPLPDVCPQSFRLLLELLSTNADDIELRAKLRGISKELFARFLQAQAALGLG